MFTDISSLKSQWEQGSLGNTKENYNNEEKKELAELRQKICLGRSESIRQVLAEKSVLPERGLRCKECNKQLKYVDKTLSSCCLKLGVEALNVGFCYSYLLF